jgi:hypothetical protein
MGNIAFVASTLPIPILKANLENWDIDEIILAGKNIEKSYNYLNKNNRIKILTTPSQKFLNLYFLFYKILNATFTRKKVYFFHECCWFNFDFLIDYFNVEAEFFPQVTLKSFIKVEEEQIHSKYQRYLLNILNISNKFIQYKVIEDNNEGHYYVLSKKKYKSNIKIHSIKESILFRNKSTSTNKKNILLLVARETVSNNYLVVIYEEIITKLNELNFNVFIKNHPREEARLNLKTNGVFKVYDPNIPFELLDDSFMCIIGCASTSLINDGQPSISIIKFSGMDENNTKLRINHLIEIPTTKKIIFPNSIDDMICEIKKMN